MLADPNISGVVSNSEGRHPPYFFPSHQFANALGSPSSVGKQWGGAPPTWELWRLHTTDYDYVSTEFLLPDYYDGDDITLIIYWTKEDSGTGNWRFIGELVGVIEGELIISGGTRKSATKTLPVEGAIHELVKTTQVLTDCGFEAGDLLLFMVGRAGAAGADTYGGDIIFMYAILDW